MQYSARGRATPVLQENPDIQLEIAISFVIKALKVAPSTYKVIPDGSDGPRLQLAPD